MDWPEQHPNDDRVTSPSSQETAQQREFSDGNARLDVMEWVLHDHAPTDFDSQADRQANRLLTMNRVSVWAVCVFAVVFVWPSLQGTATLAPIALLVVPAVFAVVILYTRKKHFSLRRYTGVPVLPEAKEAMDAFATMMRFDVARYKECLDIAKDSTTSPATATESRELAALITRHNTKLARMVTQPADQAAQAERRGWTWLKRRHLRQLDTVRLKQSQAVLDVNAHLMESDPAAR